MDMETIVQIRSTIRDMSGALGAIFWALRLAWQVLSNARRGATLDVRGVFGRRAAAIACLACWLGWAVCAYLLLAVTSISAAFGPGSRLDIAALVQPHLSVLAFVALVWQVFAFELRSRRLSAWLASGGLVCFVVALETLCVKLLWDRGRAAGDHRGSSGGLPESVTIALAVSCLVFGYWPLYVESVRHQGRSATVSTIPLIYGIVGSFSSLLSTVLRAHPLHLAVAVHTTALFLETGLLLSHLAWQLRTRHEHAVASVLGMTFDELAAECAKSGQPFRFAASRTLTLTPTTTTTTTTTTTGTSTTWSGNNNSDNNSSGFSDSSIRRSDGDVGQAARSGRGWVELGSVVQEPARVAHRLV